MQLNQTKIEKLGKALIKSTSIEQDNQILESFKLKYGCTIYQVTSYKDYVVSNGLRRYYLSGYKNRIHILKLN